MDARDKWVAALEAFHSALGRIHNKGELPRMGDSPEGGPVISIALLPDTMAVTEKGSDKIRACNTIGVRICVEVVRPRLHRVTQRVTWDILE